MSEIIMKRLKLFFVFSVSALVFACAVLVQENNRNTIPRKLNIKYEIVPSFVPQKCCFSPKEETVFLWEKNSSLIHIYRKGKEINTIGGLGFEDSNFSKLADISISPDGNLLTLDSFQNKIKKFDTEGRLITDFEFLSLSTPALFDVSADETFYIYDDNRKEIVVLSSLTGEESFAFGRFVFANPTQLTVSRNYVTVYEKDENISHVFNILGQFEEDIEGNVQFEENQRFVLKKFYFESFVGKKKFAVAPYSWNDFLIKNGYFVLSSDEKVLIAEMEYEKR